MKKKNSIGNLIGFALDLWTALGKIVIFTILMLEIQEHGTLICLCHFYLFHHCFYSFMGTCIFPS